VSSLPAPDGENCNTSLAYSGSTLVAEPHTFCPAVAATLPSTNAKCGNAAFDSDGDLYIAYAEGAPGQLEPALRASSDGGRTFGPPLFPSQVIQNAECIEVSATARGKLDLLWSEPRLDGSALYEVYYSSAAISLP
jgi:hypothetical protein